MWLLYSSQITPRLQYVLDLINEELGFEIEATQDYRFFVQSFAYKINYSDVVLHDIPQVIPHAILFEKDIRSQHIKVGEKNNISLIFADNSILGFDVFAAVFYMISRYEEYINPSNFYSYKNSIAYKNQFLSDPIVHYWLDLFLQHLQTYYPTIEKKQQKYKSCITFDIDHILCFPKDSKWKNFLKQCRDFIFNHDIYKQRKLVLKKEAIDPWFNFNYIKEKTQYHKTIFFIHTGIAQTKYDKQIKRDDKAFSEMFFCLKDNEVQWHPSVQSQNSLNCASEEMDFLKNNINKNIDKARQHFLYLNLPSTYRNLMALGIQNDYSMGYSQALGFRAGYARPFTWFDLVKNEKTTLIIHPFMFMDTTLAYFMKLKPNEALLTIESLYKKVKKVEGTFISVWHNSSLGENYYWQGWQNVFENHLKNFS